MTKERRRPRKGGRGGEHKAWLYVENKVQELLGPVQYEAAHDFSPRSPQPRGKQDGTGTGDRTTSFPLRIPPLYLSLSVCVCLCVQVAAVVGKQWCGHSHAESAHGSNKVPTEQFPSFSGRGWWTGRHRLKRATRKCAARTGRGGRERKPKKQERRSSVGKIKKKCVQRGREGEIVRERKKKRAQGWVGVIQSSFSSFCRLPSLGAAAVFSLVPYLEETVPGPSGHCHAIFSNTKAADAVVVASQHPCALGLHRVPHVAVEVVVASQEQAP